MALLMIKDTTSLCEICYKHIPAVVFQQDDSIWIKKTCSKHGNFTYMIERSAEFYNSLVYDNIAYNPAGYIVDITERCNLKCPHCYQVPDNSKKDIGIDFLIDQISNYPKDNHFITLAGAEPTMRNDLPDIISHVRKLGREVNILTNGLKLSNINYVKEIKELGVKFVTIGLNHPDYQGAKVHKRQLKGIDNCVKLGMKIKNINYTLESLDQIPFILQEIQQFGNTADEYRIRGGAEIGRFPDAPKEFLSDIVSYVKKYVADCDWKWSKPPADDNLHHYMININGISHRLIQWADVKTIDLDELICGPWGNYLPNIPMTNILHQLILRDAVLNKKIMLTDRVPSRYIKS